jgi:hypothetical protein
LTRRAIRGRKERRGRTVGHHPPLAPLLPRDRAIIEPWGGYLIVRWFR